MAAQTGNAAPVLSDFEGQGAVYDGLMRTLRDGTFVHAYLITGLEGMGKRTLARLLAQYWLCQAPEGEKRPCGVCRACQQVRDGTHADLVIIAPGKPINPAATTTAPTASSPACAGRFAPARWMKSVR